MDTENSFSSRDNISLKEIETKKFEEGKTNKIDKLNNSSVKKNSTKKEDNNSKKTDTSFDNQE